MPHIALSPDYPGVRSLFVFRPETSVPLNGLVQKLLHDPHPTMSQGERELIASYVSNLNTCKYCTSAHSAIAAHHLQDKDLVKCVIEDPSVLIAATFCLFNRYVDGLATWAPDDQSIYDRIGKQRAEEGYFTAPFKVS